MMEKTTTELLAEQNELIRQQTELLKQRLAEARCQSFWESQRMLAARWDEANPVMRVFFKNPHR